MKSVFRHFTLLVLLSLTLWRPTGASAQPSPTPTSTALMVNKNTGAITAPVSAATFQSTLTTSTRTLLILGDSLSAPNAQPGSTGNWPYHLNQLADYRGYTLVNNAVSGQSAATIVSNLSTQALPYLPVSALGSQTIVQVWAGINDLNGIGAAATYAHLKTIWSYCRSRGAKVHASTQGYASGVSDSIVDSFNALILSDQTLYDSLSRPELDFPSTSTTIPGATATAVTGAASTDLLTATAHGYVNGDVVRLVVSSGLAGLTSGTKYFVVSATTNTFALSTTVGGSAVNITSDGSGTTTLSAYYPDNTHLTPPANSILAANKQRELAAYGYESFSARKGGTVADQTLAAFNVFAAAPATTATQFGGRDYRTVWLNGLGGFYIETFSGYEGLTLIYNMHLDSGASAWRLIDTAKAGWRISLSGGSTGNGFTLSTIPAGSTTETNRFVVDSAGNLSSIAGITATGTIAAGGNVTATGTLGFASHTFLTGTGTWDPASLADGAAESFDVTVTGAAVGDIVAGVGFYTGNRFLVSGSVISANTVRCVIFNKSAGAVDLSSGTVRVLVLKW